MSPSPHLRALRALRAGQTVELLPAARYARERGDGRDAELSRVLAEAYREDARTWPGPTPPFHEEVATWGLDVFLRVAHRWHVGEDDDALPPPPPAPATNASHPADGAGYHLCADLCLRYLPPLLQRIADASPDDVLLAETAPLREAFPYTFLLAPVPAWPDELPALADGTFRGAVIDRVIARERLAVAQHPDLRPHVEVALGAHAGTLWPRFHQMRGAGQGA